MRSDKEATRQAVLRGLLGPKAPTEIGRYTLLEEVGAGGMGEVTLALDTTLDRRVALKRVRGRWLHDPTHEARLRREAQALAALSHPNVVSVFDILEHEGRIHIAMEYVSGTHLGRWVHDERPAPSKILEAYVQAGRGLAAAHAAQIVHRDFKPSNAIIDDEGVVRVLDFGLALSRFADVMDSDSNSSSSWESPNSDESGIRLTQTGATLGTPAYMAPEQLRGDATPLSDQYSFCASLWEALAGRRPPMAAQRPPRRPTRPESRAVPQGVWSVLERGLAASPSARFGDMDALLAELDEATHRRSASQRFLWLTPVAAAVLLAATLSDDPDARRQECLDALGPAPNVWSGRDPTAVRDGLFEREGPRAATIWARMESSTEEFERRWSGAAEQACTAQTDQGAVACLDALRLKVDVFATMASDADAPTAQAALSELSRLEDPAGCLGAPEDSANGADPATRALIRTVAEAEALAATTRFDRAEELFEDMLPRARLVEGAPLVRTLHGLANCQQQFGEQSAAERNLEEAYWIATTGPAAGRIPVIVSQLAFAIAGTNTGRTAEALEWLRHGEAAVERLHLPQQSREPLLTTRGILLRNVGRMPEAKVALTQAVALLDRPGADPAERGDALVHLGNTCSAMGEVDEARRHYRRAQQAYESDPQVDLARASAALDGLGIVELQGGNDHAAEAWLRTSAEAQTRASTPVAAATWSNLAQSVAGQGRYAEAQRIHALALADASERLDASHPLLATLRINVAIADIAIGQLDRAQPRAEQALRGFAESVGPDHDFTATARMALAEIDMRRGATESAREDFESALRVAQTRLECSHPLRAAALLGAAEANRRGGELERAASQFREGSQCAAELGATAAAPWQAQALVGLALIELARGAPRLAGDNIAQAEASLATANVEAVVRGRLEAARAMWASAAQRRGIAGRSAANARRLLERSGDAWARAELERTIAR